MKNIFILSQSLMLIIALNSCSSANDKLLKDKSDGLYAVMNVNAQTILLELYYKKVPLTVSSFVGLATGKFETNTERKGPYFDGLQFHRVVENFVVQSGDPTATGTGGPGYRFDDEFDSTLVHDQAGILSMANSGPGTNGSQFFITLAPTPHLNGKHAVFGKVITGLEILPTIKQGDTIEKVTILYKGRDADNFLKDISWDSFQSLQTKIKEENTKKTADLLQEIQTKLDSDTTLTKTPEGIYYRIDKKGTGSQVKNNDIVSVHYELKIYGQEEILDSSYQRGDPIELTAGANRVIQGWEIMLLKLKKGDKAFVIIPPELAYGEQGAQGIIPPNAYLQFIMEIVGIKK